MIDRGPPVWPWPRVIAHRGGGTLGPENTLAGFEVGYALGHRAVEFDVMLARDREPVVIHDAVLGRTVPGRGRVATTSAAALAALDAGSWLDARFASARVPRYVDVLAWCRARGVWMNVEIKPSSRATAAETGRVVASVTARMFEDDEGRRAGVDLSLPEFSSFSIAALDAARAAAPRFARGLLVGRVPGDWRARIARSGALALHVDHRQLDAATLAQVRGAGVPVMAYTVDDPARAVELAGWGIDAICTDRLDRIAADALDCACS